MRYDIRVWSVGVKWRASVYYKHERLFGEADTPALAIVELGLYWQARIYADKKETSE